MQLRELLKNIKTLEFAGDDRVEIRGISHNSNDIGNGYLFVAVKGFNTDGHLYIKDAVKSGSPAVLVMEPVEAPPGVCVIRVEDTRQALALLSAAFYRNPSQELLLVGVTGTNGKTTTSYLINSIFRTTGNKVGLVGTIANFIGDRKLQVQHTTPEAHQLQKLFREMADEGVQTAVMEVSSHALALNRVTGCEFDVAVFTNLTQDHLDFHQDMEDYFQAKMQLFSNIGQGVKKFPKFAVINRDDPYSERIIKGCSVPFITYGLSENAQIRAANINTKDNGNSFQVISELGDFWLNLKLGGFFNIYNALAACAVGLGCGISQEKIIISLEGIDGVPGRFERIDCGQNFTVVVDYAHTPDGLENLLKAARGISSGRLITVFGCGGDRDRSKRPLMGKIAGKYSDLSIITSDNPRSEDPIQVISDIEAGIINTVKQAQYRIIPDRRDAIQVALREARKGDFVVIAGKGHENYQIIGDKKIRFDDGEEAKLAIKALNIDGYF